MKTRVARSNCTELSSTVIEFFQPPTVSHAYKSSKIRLSKVQLLFSVRIKREVKCFVIRTYQTLEHLCNLLSFGVAVVNWRSSVSRNKEGR